MIYFLFNFCFRIEDIFKNRGYKKEERHIIDKSVGTLTYEHTGNINKHDLDLALQTLLWEKNVKNSKGDTVDVLRLKGLISTDDSDKRLVVQAVHELYDSCYTSPWGKDEERINRIVLIGRNLERSVIETLFMKCIKGSS
ncbi:hypothetical protein KUTeg_017064 [Tegillarca granosa]|uniref:CobW C-terminal domain-containing protein n=1 Tax=Tegillarca granosa TaxID=220873 RepID=A0ABQ9EMT4_TEGGR|nr:hypothetical protein KUTeg_017064 [Tegillarca granosa]